ncbi:LacI family transcriptional regulator [Orbus hercynius]|uniref:LacI family transcriptional regulator n=1 Tax=Orbus hercynius TaxID=593135 RepID=A0A495RHH8_9GAMM|nr:LacI family DNA-binding transcriptional regulator [Orbus hercynius]RKS86875.1 LacI family transcriptional regulator [Orbus hercynius]
MSTSRQVNKKPTISDVAKLAGVGKTSVSRYLNNEFDALSERIKQRIADAIKVLGYRPNQMARSLKKGGSKLIAYVIPDITNPYSIEVMQGLEKACQDNGYTLLVCNTNKDSQKEKYYLQLLVSYNVEGVIFHSIKLDVTSLKDFPFPIVLVDRKVDHFSADLVGLDNVQSTTLATNYLVESGFDAILFITQPIDNISTRFERVNTFKRIISAHSVMIGEVLELADQQGSGQYEGKLEQAISAFCQLHRGKRKAIISMNGSVTLSISLVLKRLNLISGKDIGFIGFDDPQWASVIGDGLTSIRQPTYQIGYCAFELLLKRIHGCQDAPRELLYPGELIIRHSTLLP